MASSSAQIGANGDKDDDRVEFFHGAEFTSTIAF